MSEDDADNQLVRVEHGALALTSLADNRILSEMVGTSLALANQSSIVPVDLDALVREGKRLLCSLLERYFRSPENRANYAALI